MTSTYIFLFIFCYLILVSVLIITKGSSYRILRLKMHKNSQCVDKCTSNRSWANFYSSNVKIRDKTMVLLPAKTESLRPVISTGSSNIKTMIIMKSPLLPGIFYIFIRANGISVFENIRPETKFVRMNRRVPLTQMQIGSSSMHSSNSFKYIAESLGSKSMLLAESFSEST